MGLVHVQRPITIIIKLVPNLLNHSVDYVVHIFVVFLAGRLLLRLLGLGLLFLLQLVVFFGDGHASCH